jgi:hypothetical protein
MSQPTPFHRGYSFTDYQAAHPGDPLPGPQVDAQLDNIENTLTGVLGNLALIQRDDGKLKDGAVTVDSVSAELLAAITGTDGEDGVSPPNPAFTIVTNTLAPGAAATVALSGAYPNLTLTFGVPRGLPATAGTAVLADGVYGDITISGGGTVFTLSGTAGLTAALNLKLDKTGGTLTGTVTTTVVATFGFSHNRAASPGQVGYHLYNGGGVAEWLTYQAAHGVGDQWRVGSLVAGVVTDHLIVDPTGYVTILGTNAALELRDRDGAGAAVIYNLNDAFRLTFGGGDKFSVDAAGNGSFVGNITSGGTAVSLVGHTHAIADVVGLQAALDAKQPAGAYATAAALAGKADAITVIGDFDSNVVVSDGSNGQYIRHVGSTIRTVTFGNLTAGVALICVNRSSANTTIACPGGYYKNGGAIATANLTLAPGGKFTAFHEGGGVWAFEGTGF